MSAQREDIIEKVRAGWPDHGSVFYPARNGFCHIPMVRDGGTTARLIEFAVDTALAALKSEES